MDRERNEEHSELDRVLEEMAQETPEMPADFHNRWISAVRDEAQNQSDEKQRDRRRQWRYILSAAAVFVFLIGGTLLTRGQKNSVRPAAVPEPKAAVITAEKNSETETGGAMEEAEEERAETAMKEAAPVMDSAAEEPAEEAAEAAADGAFFDSAAFEEDAAAVEDDYEAAAVYEESMDAEEADFEADSAEAVPAAGNAVMSAALGSKAAENAAIPEPAETPEATLTPAPTEVPTAVPTETPTEVPTETPEPEPEEPEADEGFTGFLKDLGIFTLKTAALACLVLLGALLYRTWKKQKNGKKQKDKKG